MGYASAVLLLAATLLFLAASLVNSSPRIQVHRFTPEKSATIGRRSLLESGVTDIGFRAVLHRRHPDSRSLNLTREELFFEAVTRSKARAAALAKVHKVKSSMATRTLDYQSPVASINGAYTMEIKLGSPPQKFSAIADTGSDLVWIQCKPCTQCYSQNDPLFDTTRSSSYGKSSCRTSTCQGLPAYRCSNAGTCIYGYQYGDSSSTQGDLSTEVVTLTTTAGGGKGFSGFKFGCGRLNSGSFGGAAGIVGLGQGELSLATQLSASIGGKFSYCLVDFDDDSSKTSPLLFGAAAVIVKAKVQSTPIIPNSAKPTYYYIGLESVAIGGKTLSLATKVVEFYTKVSNRKIRSRTLEVNAGGTIIDSGTTLTLLDDSVYNKIKSAFSAAISLPTVDGSSAGFDLCYDISSNRKHKFPTLALGFKGTTFYPPQANYFVVVDTAATVSCLAMGGSGGLGLGIIGNLMQQNYQFLYDRSAGLISFAPAKCDSL